jgi:hypothetical protein
MGEPGSRSSRGTSANTAAKRSVGTSTQSERRVLIVAFEIRKRPVESSRSPQRRFSSSETRRPVASRSGSGSR